MSHRFSWSSALLIWLALLGFGTGPAALAHETSVIPGGYSMDVWQVEDGLPDNTVTSIVQTRDGYLWLGTFQGLVRFDGLHFTVFDSTTPGIESERATRLFVDSHGVLWVTMEYGQVARYADGKFTPMTAADGWPGLSVKWMANGPDGTLLVTVGRDEFGPRIMLEYRNGRFTEVLSGSPPPAERIRKADSLGDTVVEVDTTGRKWVVQDRHLGFMEGSRWVPWTPPGGQEAPSISRISASTQGGLWVCAEGQIRRLVNGAWSTNSPVYPWPADAAVMELMEDSKKQLWAGSWGHGLLRASPDGSTEWFTTGNGLPSNTANCVFEDREHNLWVGTSGGGLLRLRRRSFTAYGRGQGLPPSMVATMAEDSAGQQWAGMSAKGLWHLAEGRFSEPLSFSPVPSGVTVRALLTARDGSLWLGLHGNWLFHVRESGFSTYTREQGMDHDVIYTLFEDRDGLLWIGGDKGLSHFDGRKFNTYTTRDGLSANLAWAITQDKQGDLWIGTSGGGINRLHDGHFQVFTRRDGLAHDSVRCFLADDDGTLWIGTAGGGMSRLRNGRFTTYSISSGLSGNIISAILDDGLGCLWLNSNRGVFQVARSELEAYAPGRQQQVVGVTYLPADGLASIQGGSGNPTAVRGRDGRLWFAMEKGLSVIDPRHIESNLISPSTVIEEVSIDGIPAFSNGPRGTNAAASPITITPGRQRVDIHYAGLSLSAPERVRFKYRLEGLEDRWEEAGIRRSVTYHSLPPRLYRFQVLSANSDGVWDTQGAVLNLRVMPAWWQTWWFRGSAIIVLLGTVAGGYRVRIRALTRARVQQEDFSRHLIASQEAERKRIAAELHDSLGQNLLVIKSRVSLAQQQAGPTGKIAEQLSEAASMTLHAIREVRDISQNLRPFQLDELGLTKAMTSMVRKVASASTIQFTCDIAELRGLLTPEFEINLYRILQECLNNVVKHSRATQCAVTVIRSTNTIRLTVSDNGHGFAAAELLAKGSARDGFGLAGISERVRTLGGHVEFSSRPNNGALVTVTVPLGG